MNDIISRPESLTENSVSEVDHPAPAKHTVSWEIAKYVISFFIICFGVGALLFLASLATPPVTEASNALIQQVDTYELQPYNGLLDMVVTGSVVPHREIKIAAEVGGTVANKYPACEAGNFVNKGEKLLEIDAEEYQIEIRKLEAEVLQSEKRIEENKQQIAGEELNIELAKQDLELQKQEFERNRRARGVLSQTELDQSQRALNSAQTQLTNRESNLATLKAGTARLRAALQLSNRLLEKAKLDLRRTTIVAPDDGVIVQEMVQEGDYVLKGTHIVTFEDTKKAEVLCNLTPADLIWIRANAPSDSELIDSDPRAVYRLPKTDVIIYDPDDPQITWQGVLERFDGIGRDEITKTIPCRIVIQNPIVQTDTGPRALVRGMYVKCRVEVQTTSGEDGQLLVSFPAGALYPGDHVWIVKDERLRRIDVEVVDLTETMVDGVAKEIVIAKTVNDELQPGNAIVISPLSEPKVGDQVIDTTENSASPAEISENISDGANAERTSLN